MNLKYLNVLLVILALSIIACKKEKSDIYAEYSQADPIISGIENNSKTESKASIGKINENGVTELSKSDSISDAQTAFVVNNDDKYQYKLVLEKGQTYPLNTTSINTVTTKFRDKSATQTTTSIEDLDFKVLQVQNGNYKMEATFVKSKMVYSGGGQSVTVESTQPKPSQPMLIGGWMIQKARKGKKITFQMDENGNISNVKGFDQILADVKKQFQTELKGEELEQLYQMAAQQINGENFKQQIEQGMIKFPKGGAKVGESWTEKAGGGGSLTFTLSKIENGKAYINVSSKYPPQSDQQSQNGITVKQTATMNTSGTIQLDLNSGWIAKGLLTDKMNQKEVASNGQETQTSSVNTTNVTKINE